MNNCELLCLQLKTRLVEACWRNTILGRHFNNKKLRGLSPQVNYTDRRMSAKLVPTFADRVCRVVSATDPHGRILGFLNRSRYYFFHVTHQLYSRS
jgi:hypothetical protein